MISKKVVAKNLTNYILQQPFFNYNIDFLMGI